MLSIRYDTIRYDTTVSYWFKICHRYHYIYRTTYSSSSSSSSYNNVIKDGSLAITTGTATITITAVVVSTEWIATNMNQMYKYNNTTSTTSKVIISFLSSFSSCMSTCIRDGINELQTPSTRSTRWFRSGINKSYHIVWYIYIYIYIYIHPLLMKQRLLSTKIDTHTHTWPKQSTKTLILCCFVQYCS